nr:hypothetical protein Iba_chr04aCG6200 [Ipomoea batatas]GMC90030.1 hypothetical protein Iba_chr04fCG4260 [Ipomoea batatas]GMD24704.1 hypothetical protein Iba_scaffold75530CG0010 [Ipomoea batatas]
MDNRTSNWAQRSRIPSWRNGEREGYEGLRRGFRPSVYGRDSEEEAECSVCFPLYSGNHTTIGTPLLLNPPSISVYTTGSSLLPPENHPTANPPPKGGSCSFEEGRLVVLKSPEFGASVGSWWWQTGQDLRKDSHGRMQSKCMNNLTLFTLCRHSVFDVQEQSGHLCVDAINDFAGVKIAHCPLDMDLEKRLTAR